MAQRIKGQETEVMVAVNGQPVTSINAIKSLEVSFDQEIKDEGYLGETTNRKDAIFNGISGNIEFNFDSPDAFDIIVEIVDKARRRTPGTTINVQTTLNFPSGRRRRIILPNVEFGAIPMSFGSRGDFGSLKLEFQGSDYNFLT